MEFIVNQVNDLKIVAKFILDEFPNEKIILLKGNLAAGKTTFCQQFCEVLGLNVNVQSPTFGLVNVYSDKSLIVNHFDLYRLKSIHEIEDIGIWEYIDSENYCLIEWPEILEQKLENYIELQFEVNENFRKVKVNKFN